MFILHPFAVHILGDKLTVDVAKALSDVQRERRRFAQQRIMRAITVLLSHTDIGAFFKTEKENCRSNGKVFG